MSFHSQRHSPNSWGNSSHTMAVDVLNPVRTDTVNEAPMARPSMKLCTASLSDIIQATVLMLVMRFPRSQWHITSGTWESCNSDKRVKRHVARVGVWSCQSKHMESMKKGSHAKGHFNQIKKKHSQTMTSKDLITAYCWFSSTTWTS